MTSPDQRANALRSMLFGALGALITLIIVAGILFLTFPQQVRGLISLSDTSQEKDRGINAEQTMVIKENQVTDVVKQVSPAVVAISLSKEVPTYENSYGDSYDPFEEFFGMPSPFGDLFERNQERKQTGTEEVEIGGGTGFLISDDGYIVTNKHVVDEDDVMYRVITDDGEIYDAEIIAKDPIFDIAIIKIDGSDFPHLSFGDSDGIEIGQTAIAIGNALAEFRNTVSLGVVSGLSRSITAEDGHGGSERLEGLIQTDAAINPGNSGGPLLNLNGEVIGVNVAMSGGENLGFALPGNMVKSVAESVKENGKISRPFLGVRYILIDEDLQEKNALEVDYGVLVIRGEGAGELAVMPGSAADKAGITENDILLEVNGVKIDDEHSLASLLRNYQPGDTVKIKLLKKGEEEEVDVVLGEYPAE